LVNLRIVQDMAEGGLIAVGTCVADHVHRIFHVGRGRQGVPQTLLGGLGQSRHRQAHADGRIGGHHARSAGIGYDGQPVALGHGRIGVHNRSVEHFINGVYTYNTRFLKHGVADRVFTGQGAGMTGRRIRPLGRPARFDGQDRFGIGSPGNTAGHLQQFSALPQLLQIKQNHIRLGVLMEVVQKVDFGYPGLIAETDKLGKPDLLFPGIVQNGRAQGAGLAQESDPARHRHLAGKRGVQLHRRVRIDHAQAVRPNQPDAVFGANGLQPLFPLDAFRPDLSKPGRNHNGRLDPLFATLLQGPIHHLGREHNDGQIDLIVNIEHITVRTDCTNASFTGCHRIQCAFVATG